MINNNNDDDEINDFRRRLSDVADVVDDNLNNKKDVSTQF